MNKEEDLYNKAVRAFHEKRFDDAKQIFWALKNEFPRSEYIKQYKDDHFSIIRFIIQIGLSFFFIFLFFSFIFPMHDREVNMVTKKPIPTYIMTVEEYKQQKEGIKQKADEKKQLIKKNIENKKSHLNTYLNDTIDDECRKNCYDITRSSKYKDLYYECMSRCDAEYQFRHKHELKNIEILPITPP